MTIRVVLPAALTLCIFLCSPPVCGQMMDQATLSLQKAIGDMKLASAPANNIHAPTAPDRNSADWRKPLLSSIQKNANAIQAAAGGLSAEEREPYARTLLFDADLLRAATKETDAAAAREMLTQVDADLKIKASATAGMGMASRFNGRVVVNVVTLRSGQVVPDLVIILNPLAYKGTTPFIRFKKLSSPSSGSAPPGRYRLITMQSGEQRSTEVVDIGLDAQDDITLEVQVP
ncbi:hypothetical protein [Janthinobacterium svalbardensis]|uniref:hypothetical protein n=1 Tax=Janthinobacterium svalbardensis TaxID=368607 RepID=UPI002FCDA552